MRFFKRRNDPEKAAMWLTIGSLAKDTKDLREKVARLEGDISKLRRVVKREARHPTPEFQADTYIDTVILPKNGGSRADKHLMGFLDRDDGACVHCAEPASEHGCP